MSGFIAGPYGVVIQVAREFGISPEVAARVVDAASDDQITKLRNHLHDREAFVTAWGKVVTEPNIAKASMREYRNVAPDMGDQEASPKYHGGSVEFFRDGSVKMKAGSDRVSAYPEGAGEFIAEQSASIRARHTEPLQTRLQKRAMAHRALVISDSSIDLSTHRIDAVLLEEAIAELQRYEDQYAKILKILTPEFKPKSYFPTKKEGPP